MAMYLPEIVEEVSENAYSLVEDNGKVKRLKGGLGGNSTETNVIKMEVYFDADWNAEEIKLNGIAVGYNDNGDYLIPNEIKIDINNILPRFWLLKYYLLNGEYIIYSQYIGDPYYYVDIDDNGMILGKLLEMDSYSLYLE